MLKCIFDFSIGTSFVCIERMDGDDEWSQIIYENETTISKVFLLIVEFIEWYNKNNKL